jgi:hypothetical protein
MLKAHDYEPYFFSGAKVFQSELAWNYRATSSNTTLIANTSGQSNADGLVEVTSGSPTLTLPSAVNIQGEQFTVKNTGAGTVTVACTGGQTIDGSSTSSLTQNVAKTYVSNGTNWLII